MQLIHPNTEETTVLSCSVSGLHNSLLYVNLFLFGSCGTPELARLPPTHSPAVALGIKVSSPCPKRVRPGGQRDLHVVSTYKHSRA